jgi:hypothetical protein
MCIHKNESLRHITQVKQVVELTPFGLLGAFEHLNTDKGLHGAYINLFDEALACFFQLAADSAIATNDPYTALRRQLPP